MIKLSFALFVILCVVTLTLPAIIGIILITRFGKDKLVRLIALFTLKPIVAYPLWLLIRFNLSPIRFGLMPGLPNPSEDILLDVKASLFALIPAVALTLGILLVFWQSFQAKSAWLFLVGDAIRWLYAFFVSVTIFNYPTNPPYLGLLFIIVGSLFPSVYAVVALTFVNSRNRSIFIAQGV